MVVARTGTANPRRPKIPNGWRGIMRTKIRRLALLGLLMGGLLGTGLMAPATAAGTTQVDGPAALDAVACDSPPVGFTDYPGLHLTGDIEGCLYTHVGVVKRTPSGVWLETGQEIVIGSMNGGPEGTFMTTYHFEGKYDNATGLELKGRCHHPIVKGSGTGGFAGATGRLDFKDIIGDPVVYVYRGHIKLG